MTTDTTTAGPTVRLQPLTFVDDGDAVVVGRPDTGSYGVFPPEGADLLRALAAGATLESAVAGWRRRTGQTLDVEDFLAVLDDLGFVVEPGGSPVHPPPVRWPRLSRAVFSPPAWVFYVVAVVAGAVLMVADPTLRPGYDNIFFTSHISLIPVAIALTQIPLLLLHEGFHALAARRLGLPSTLGIGRRFYYLVAETRLDSLYSVPRARRYLPFFAGSLVDLVGIGVFTGLSAVTRSSGAPPWISGLALALAFTGVLRILWECLFYLETDFYFVISTATGCADLHGAAWYRVKAFVAPFRRRARPDGEEWSEHDRAVARWFAPLMIAGYGLSLAMLLLVALPTAVRFWTTVGHRFDGSQPVGPVEVVDTVVFVLLSLAELGLLAYVTVRDLRRRRARVATTSEGNAS